MRLLLALLVVAAACRQEAAAPPPLTGPFVVLKLDGRALAAVPITHPIPLAQLVPAVPPWLLVEAAAPDGRYLELSEPATTYPGAEIRLDLQQGRITIGVFNPPVTGVSPELAALAAQPIATLSGVVEIDVLTRPRERQGGAGGGLEVVVGGTPGHVFAPGELASLDEARPRPRIRGWALRDVIDAAVPDAKYNRVQVIAAGAQQTFSREEITSAKVHYILKLNQRGQYVLGVWDDSTLDRPRIQLRDVTKLVLDPP